MSGQDLTTRSGLVICNYSNFTQCGAYFDPGGGRSLMHEARAGAEEGGTGQGSNPRPPPAPPPRAPSPPPPPGGPPPPPPRRKYPQIVRRFPAAPGDSYDGIRMSL